MKTYLEHPTELLNLLWAFWLCVALGTSIVCVPLSFLFKCSTDTFRISKALLWGMIPLIVFYLIASYFDSPNGLGAWLLGLLVSCLPAVPSLLAFEISRTRKSSTTTNGSEMLKSAVIVLGIALTVCIGLLGYLLWQNYWWRFTVDSVADQAGAAEAMSSFRKGRLVLWEINPTNDFPRFSGRHDGPFEVWFDEYHPEMPAPWHYSQRRMDDANNTQMRYMYQHPQKFRGDTQSSPDATNRVGTK